MYKKQLLLIAAMVGFTATVAMAASSGDLNGPAVRRALAGKTIYLSASGIVLPIKYSRNGTMSGISSEYLGEKMVQGVKTHHLSFGSTGADWQIWIEADATPLPRRFAITYVNTKGEPQYLAQLDRWSMGGAMDASLFKAGVPESAKKVPFAK